MKKIALIGLIIGFASPVAIGQDGQPVSLDLNNRPLIAQELKALSTIARESVRDIEEKYRSFKEHIDQITQETDLAKKLAQLIRLVEPTAQVLVKEWSKIGYQAGELLDTLSALAINETETQKIKEIAQSLKTASREFDEFRNLIQTKVFPILEQNLEQLKTSVSVSTEPAPKPIEELIVTEPVPAPTEESPLTEPLPFPSEEPPPSPETPTEPSETKPVTAEPTSTPEAGPTEQPAQTELPTPPVEEPTEPSEPESTAVEPTPSEEPSAPSPEEPESLTAPTEAPSEPAPETKPEQTIDEDIDNLPGSAPEIAQLLNKGKVQGTAEAELKKLLEQRDKDFDEKFPGPEFLAFIGDLNILHAYAKATRDYVNLAKQAQEKQDNETVDRLQEKIDEIKQKYVNKINEINDRYRSTEWYVFYTQ